MIDFAPSPNVKVIITMHAAGSLLKSVKWEMQKRLDYLEKPGKKQLRAGINKKDRILVAIDEAGVTYMNRPPQQHRASSNHRSTSSLRYHSEAFLIVGYTLAVCHPKA